jgi:predicted 3-demethylubiquinone-9 3-methyltransferase (glyoxalase superfamily)
MMKQTKNNKGGDMKKFIYVWLLTGMFYFQLFGGNTTDNKISTFLMFEGDAEEAVNFYVSLFPDSEIINIVRYGPEMPAAEGNVYHARFTLSGRTFMAFDSPAEHPFTFTPSVSLFVQCDTENELDVLFEKLSDGGEILMPLGEYPFSEKYVWINDRFGVSWQLSWRLNVGAGNNANSGNSSD